MYWGCYESSISSDYAYGYITNSFTSYQFESTYEPFAFFDVPNPSGTIKFTVLVFSTVPFIVAPYHPKIVSKSKTVGVMSSQGWRSGYLAFFKYSMTLILEVVSDDIPLGICADEKNTFFCFKGKMSLKFFDWQFFQTWQN